MTMAKTTRMGNHYHRLAKTPEGSLVSEMQWLQRRINGAEAGGILANRPKRALRMNGSWVQGRNVTTP